MTVRRLIWAVSLAVLVLLGVVAAVAPRPSTVSTLITTVDPGRAVFGLHDSAGHSMDTLDVVPDPTHAGRFLGVYHWSDPADGYDVGVATSTDLRRWTYRRTLDTQASQPSLAFSPDDEPVLADEGYRPTHLRFLAWPGVREMLGTAAPSLTVDAARTLSSCAEGTPDIRAITFAGPASTITHGSTIVVGHHYYAGCRTDREAVGVLRNFRSWSTQPEPAVDDRLTAAGAIGKHGDRDTFRDHGQVYTVYEGAITAASAPSDWRIFLDDGPTAAETDPRTPGGSTAFANPTATVASVAGTRCLIVTVFIPETGAAGGEAGELLYWNPLS